VSGVSGMLIENVNFESLALSLPFTHSARSTEIACEGSYE